jgi:hypothetical protein
MGDIGNKVGIEGVYSDEFLSGARLGANAVIYSVEAMLRTGEPGEEMARMIADFKAAVKDWTNERD